MGKKIRNNYIRFFLSSTFADMELERNIINSLFRRLNKEYSLQGWQVELIDLRWGITQEATKANLTMDICMHELKLCLQMSPRPNFLLLMGQRYGWIPVPSSLSQTEMNRLQDNSAKEEKDLLDYCYIQDTNCTDADGNCFILKANNNIQDKELIKLSDLLQRNSFKKSATGQEIEEGIFAHGELRERVIAYRRIFRPCDELLHSAYIDDNHELQSKLADKVEQSVPSENFIKTIISFEDYNGSEYAVRFEKDIESHVRKLIDREIALSAENPITENDIHLDFATKYSEGFIDTATDIALFRQYIESNADDLTPVWLKSNESGTGITSLLSQLVTEYTERSDYEVIARFCGLTQLSSQPRLLIDSILEEIAIRLNNKTRLREVKTCAEVLSDQMLPDIPSSHFIGANINKLPKDRRFLFIIDGLDIFTNLEYSDAPIFDLRWICTTNLPNNVRVILSTNKSENFFLSALEATHYRNKKIADDWGKFDYSFSITDHEREFIEKSLSLKGRNLTLNQWRSIDSWIRHGSCNRAMLSALADEASALHSFDNLESYNSNSKPSLIHIYEAASKRMRRLDLYGATIYNAVIEILSFSPEGVPDDTMRRLLWRLSEVREFVQSDMNHAYDADSIPQLFWSRLRRDCNAWLEYAYTSIGTVTKLRYPYIPQYSKEGIWECQLRWINGELKRIGAITTEPRKESLVVLSVLVNYANANWQHEPWALRHLPWLLCKCALCHAPIGENALYTLSKLFENPDYIACRYNLDGATMCEDISRIIKLTSNKYRGYEKVNKGDLLRLMTEIRLSGKKMSADEFRLYSLSQSSRSKLYSLFSTDTRGLLSDSLKGLSPNDVILAHIGTGLTLLAIGDGGRKIALTDNSRRFLLRRVFDTGSDNSLFDNSPIIKVSGDSDLTTICVLRNNNSVTFYRFEENILTGNYHEPLKETPDKKVLSVSLSRKGDYAVVVTEAYTRIYQLGYFTENGCISLDWKKRHFHTLAFSAEEVRFTHDGNFVWIQYGKIMLRYNLTDWKHIQIDTSNFPKPDLCYDRHATFYTISYATANRLSLIWGQSIAIIDISATGKWKAKIIGFNANWSVNATLIPKSEPDSLYIFYKKGHWQRIDLSDFSKENLPVTYGHNHTVSIISDDLKALGSQSGFLLNFEKCMNFDYTEISKHHNIFGINHAAADASGSVFLLTKGRNPELQLYSTFNVIAKDGNKRNNYPLPINYSTVAFACAVAPDRSKFAISSARIAIYDAKNREIIHEDNTCRTLCSGLAFTSDSKWLIASEGDYIRGCQPNVWIYDSVGNFIRTFENADYSGVMDDALFNLTPDNRFLVHEDGSVLDLINEKELSIAGFSGAFKWAISPDSHYMYYNQTGRIACIELKTGIISWLNINMRVLACSPDGKFLYVIDNASHLHKIELQTQNLTGRMGAFFKNQINAETSELIKTIPVDIKEPISAVFPTPDGKFLFAITSTGHTLFCDTDGNILETTVQSGTCFALCATGILAAEDTGIIHFFEPSPQFGLNKKVYAYAIRRYRLDRPFSSPTETPTIVCPVCGRVNNDSTTEFNCSNCNTPIIPLH